MIYHLLEVGWNREITRPYTDWSIVSIGAFFYFMKE